MDYEAEQPPTGTSPLRQQRQHGPAIVGPGRRNGLPHLSPLPELTSLDPSVKSASTQDALLASKLDPREYVSENVEEVEAQKGKLFASRQVMVQSGPNPQSRKLSRHRSPKLIALLLLLLLLGGSATYGIYSIKVNILEPLANFFHLLQGDNESDIYGRSWNLLLLGSDNDNKFVYPNLLTQVMMVVHIDPVNNRVSIVSIPRDSWVSIPGNAGMHKIDQAFYLGASQHRNFDDGMHLARATIEQDYGIPIDRYAWIGLDGFASVINTLGGIDIDIPHPILDDDYPDDLAPGGHNSYAVKRLYLPPGPQHLSGSDTLEFVRSRHADLVGDIGRTQRQQEVLTALKQKLNFSGIVKHLSEIFKDLNGKIYTDLNQSELLSLADFSRNLSPEAIQHLTLGPGKNNQNYGTLSQVNDPGLNESQDVLRPNCATIQPVINSIFDLVNVQSCQVNGP